MAAIVSCWVPKDFSPAAASPKSPKLSDELAALDRAQTALHAGDGEAALAAIDNYEQRFVNKRLAPEAQVLRIEALLRQGRRDSAHQTALAFLGAHPNSPYAPRVRHLAKQAEKR